MREDKVTIFYKIKFQSNDKKFKHVNYCINSGSYRWQKQVGNNYRNTM